MIKKLVKLNHQIGSNARAASLFVQAANKFSSNIYIEFENKKVDGKSIIGVMSLGAFYGEKITLIVNGEDEKEAMEELAKLIKEIPSQ